MQTSDPIPFTFNKPTAKTKCGIVLQGAPAPVVTINSLNTCRPAAFLAKAAGLQVGDTVISITGENVKSATHGATLLKAAVGEVKILVTREFPSRDASPAKAGATEGREGGSGGAPPRSLGGLSGAEAAAAVVAWTSQHGLVAAAERGGGDAKDEEEGDAAYRPRPLRFSEDDEDEDEDEDEAAGKDEAPSGSTARSPAKNGGMEGRAAIKGRTPGGGRDARAEQHDWIVKQEANAGFSPYAGRR